MTRSKSFSESFWDRDFLGTEGFDTLVRRLKEGRQMCKDMEEFLKGRAKLEEEYFKGLHKLVRNTSTNHEIGTLKESWQTLVTETQQVAKEHSDMCEAIGAQIIRISKFTETIKSTAKQAEEAVRKAVQKKRDLYKKTTDAKKAYEARCREADQLEENVKQMRQQGSNISPKEVEKMSAKQNKSRQEAEKADKAYKGLVDTLDQARIQWENEMHRACESFQQVEEERIAFLRNEMWINANLCSQTTVDIDKHQEVLRQSLENCDVDRDISIFVKDKHTGSERPGAIFYENYYHPGPNRDSGGSIGSAGLTTLPTNNGGSPSRASPQRVLPPGPQVLPPPGNRPQFTLPAGPRPHLPMGPRPPGRNRVPDHIEDSTYASIP